MPDNVYWNICEEIEKFNLQHATNRDDRREEEDFDNMANLPEGDK